MDIRVQPWEVAVRASVEDLVARYTWGADRGHTGEVADCFTADGVLDVGIHGGRWVGRDRIAAELEAVVSRVAETGGGPGPVRHHVSNLLIDAVSTDSARARSYFLVTAAVGVDHWGRYYDEIRTDGLRWRFVERVVRVDGRSERSLMVPA